MNRKLPSRSCLGKACLTFSLILVSLTSIFTQDTLCSQARLIDSWSATLFADSARFHRFVPPSDGVIAIQTCDYNYFDFKLYDDCLGMLPCCEINSSSGQDCLNGVVLNYPAIGNDAVFFELLPVDTIPENQIDFQFVPNQVCPQDSIIELGCNTSVDTTTIGGSSFFNYTYYVDCVSEAASDLEYNGADRVFHFNAPATQNYIFQLESFGDNLDFFLFDELCAMDGPPNCILANTDDTNLKEIGPIELAAGDYFIVIDGATDNIGGAFTLTSRCPQCDYTGPDFEQAEQAFCNSSFFGNMFEAGNAFIAEDYGCYMGNKTYQGQDRLFFVDVPVMTNLITVTLVNPTADLDIFLFNSLNECVGSSTNDGTANEIIQFTENPFGRYFVVVDGEDCGEDTDFTLLLGCECGVSVTFEAERDSVCLDEVTTLTAMAQGLGSSFTFEWQDDIEPIEEGGRESTIEAGQGLYCVTVTNSQNCRVSGCFIIDDLGTPFINNLISTTLTCGQINGSIEVDVNNGIDTVRYSLDNQNFQTENIFTDLFPGEYTVYVQNGNGCTNLDETVVEEIPPPTIDNITTTSDSCSFGLGTILVEASSPNSSLEYSIGNEIFQTSNFFEGVVAGAYTVSIRDATSCTISESVFVEDVPGPQFEDVSIEPDSCGANSGRIDVFTIGGAGIIRYSIDGINFQTDNSFVGLNGGDYLIRLLDENNCMEEMEVTIPLLGAPSITTHPQRVVLCNAGQVFFSASANVDGDGELSSQWQVNEGEDWTNLSNNSIYSGVNSDTLQIANTQGLSGNLYRVLYFTEFCTDPVISEEAQLIVEGPISIAQSPTDVGSCVGESASFSVTANGGNDTNILYQWQLSTNGGLDWSDLPNGSFYSGVDTETLMISDVSNLNNFRFRVRVFSEFCPQIISEDALLTVERPMSVTAQPNNVSVCANEVVSFSFTINSNGFDNPQFQWEFSSDGGSNWQDLEENAAFSGTTTTTLTVNDVSGLNNYLFRARIMGQFCEDLFTNVAFIRVEGQVGLSEHPQSTTTCSGDATSFSIMAEDSEIEFSINWEESTNNGGSWSALVDGGIYSGANSNTLNISNVTGLQNNQYRAVLTTNECEPTISNTATLNIEGPISISNHPLDELVCAGESASFSAIAVNEGIGAVNFQWQINMGDGWQNLDNDGVFNGTQTDNLSISNTFGLNTAQFRIIINTTNCPPQTSDPSTLTTEGPVLFANQPQNIAVCDDGTPVTFSAMAFNEGAGEIEYQWEISTDGENFNIVNNNAVYSGANGTTLTISDVQGLGSSNYRLRASTPNCPPVFSNMALLEIEGPVSISKEGQPQDVMACSGEAVTFNVIADAGAGGNLNYQWQVREGQDWLTLTNNNTYNGVATPTLSVSNVNGLNGRQYRVLIVTDLCQVPAISETATLVAGGVISFTQQPQSQILCAGSSTSFMVDAQSTEEDDFSYQWQVSENGGGNWLDLQAGGIYNNVNTNELLISDVTDLNNNQYRARISSQFCGELFSDAANITVEGPIGVLSQPVDVTACSGTGTSFQIDATNTGQGNLSYQWEISMDGGNQWFLLSDNNFNYSGATTPVLSINDVASLNGALFRAAVQTERCARMESQAALLTVEGPVTFIQHPESQSVCDDGSTISFTAQAENENTGNLSYQWQQSSDGNNFSNINDSENYEGFNTPMLTLMQANNFDGFQYRLMVQTTTCPAMISETALLRIDAPIIQAVEVIPDTCDRNNGQITVFAEEGFGVLLYSDDGENFQTSNAFGSLGAGDYSFFVQDENGCMVAVDTALSNLPAPMISAVTTIPDTCDRFVGAITIEASGTSEQVFYSLDGGPFQTIGSFDNLMANTYLISVRDEYGCLTTQNVEVGEAVGMLAIDLVLEENSGTTPNDGTICATEAVTLTASASGGNDDYTYVWNNDLEEGNQQNLNPTESATYVVTATDGNQCFAIDSVSVTVLESPIASINSNSPVCEGSSIIFSAAGGTSYQWTGPNDFISNEPNPTIPESIGANEGTYTLMINNQNNCGNIASVDVVVIGPTNYPAMVSAADEFICENAEDNTARLQSNDYPEINAQGIWFTNSTGVDIEGVVSTTANATKLNYRENTFWWALSAGECEEFSTDSVTIWFEQEPMAMPDSVFSYENVPIDTIDVISNDNIDNMLEWEVEVVAQPERARVTYNGNGSFKVVPDETFFGELRFKYRLFSLSCNRFDEGEVIIDIQPNTDPIHCVWTPETDGDFWEICRDYSPNNQLLVMNRYGTIVHIARPYSDDWDGTDIRTGKPVPTGTYYFVLKQDKETEEDDELLGTVIILR